MLRASSSAVKYAMKSASREVSDVFCQQRGNTIIRFFGELNFLPRFNGIGILLGREEKHRSGQRWIDTIPVENRWYGFTIFKLDDFSRQDLLRGSCDKRCGALCFLILNDGGDEFIGIGDPAQWPGFVILFQDGFAFSLSKTACDEFSEASG